MNTTFPRAFGVLLSLVVLGGCRSYEKDYQASFADAQFGQITGPWVGTWQSEADNHGGELRAIVTRLGENEYRVRYKAEYSNLMPDFKHETLLHGIFAGETFHFEGSADLGGLAGGVYEYTGYATTEEFYSTFLAKDDHGIYILERPAPEGYAEQKAEEFQDQAIEALSEEPTAPPQPGDEPAPVEEPVPTEDPATPPQPPAPPGDEPAPGEEPAPAPGDDQPEKSQ